MLVLFAAAGDQLENGCRCQRFKKVTSLDDGSDLRSSGECRSRVRLGVAEPTARLITDTSSKRSSRSSGLEVWAGTHLVIADAMHNHEF